MKPKLLELFAGTRSVGKEAEKLGFEVFSSDLATFKGIDYQCSILDFDSDKLPWSPHVVWASPPCTLFSNANQKALTQHWNKTETKRRGIQYTAKSDEAREALNILRATIKLIRQLNPKVFYIKNPAMGRMKHFDEMKGFRRVKVSYYDYGFNYWKPTNIFTNDINFVPRPFTHVTDIDPSRRKMVLKTGGAKYRSKIPPELCKHILISALENINGNLDTINYQELSPGFHRFRADILPRLSKVGIQSSLIF